MEIRPTGITGCFEIIPKVFKDERGHFFESFHQKAFEKATGITPHFLQDNQSFSKYGVLRGLHFQKGDHAQAKLVRVLEGEVLDIIVDIRPNSKTYGETVRTLLSSENKKQLFIPRGCAHGFVTLSEHAVFFYKCDNFYSKETEGGIVYNDPTLDVDWILAEEELIVSEKDKALPTFKELVVDTI